MDERSGSIDGFDSYGLCLDYFDLNEFSGPKDAYYRLVSDEIRRFLGESSNYQQNLDAALHKAAFDGDATAAKESLALGANTQTHREDGTTPLHDASFHGHVDVVRVLLKRVRKQMQEAFTARLHYMMLYTAAT